MNQLTAFERALLAQFEKLASDCETSLKASGSTSATLRELSATLSDRLARIEAKQAEIEAFQQNLLTVLQGQSEGVSSLVEQVNRLLNASGR